MKFFKKWKQKKQIMVALLALLIAAAGYVNYSGFEFATKETSSTEVSNETVSVNDDETPVGEAVLTSAEVANYVAQAKLTREQTHEKAKETLEETISSMNKYLARTESINEEEYSSEELDDIKSTRSEYQNDIAKYKLKLENINDIIEGTETLIGILKEEEKERDKMILDIII